MSKMKEQVGRLIAEIEAKFGIHVPRSPINDAPYPFFAASMPVGWCWDSCWALYEDCLERMWLMCDRKHETIDTCETLLLEAVRQYCNSRYEEFLGLPTMPFIRHPLQFAIGHLHHGQQMRTGWGTTHPNPIADRDDALNKLLCETCFSNYMKHNFDEATYPLILADIAKSRFPVISLLLAPSAKLGA